MVGTLFLKIFFLHNSWDKLKMYMFATEQHVFIHFMNFPVILVQVYFYPTTPHPTPHPLAKQWKKKFHGFIHFMKFLDYHDYCVHTSGINSFVCDLPLRTKIIISSGQEVFKWAKSFKIKHYGSIFGNTSHELPKKKENVLIIIVNAIWGLQNN